MKVGELFDVVNVAHFRAVEYDPATQKKTVMFDNGDETMYEEGLDEQVATATVKAVYSFVDETGEDTIQADFWKIPSR